MRRVAPATRRASGSMTAPLSAKGRADAASIGARLRSEGIAVERILSSPWCRCMDTATLLELGPVEAEPTFGNVVVLSEQRESLTAAARAVIDKWTGSGILVVVTHGANIFALTGISPASGEIVVVRSGNGGGRETFRGPILYLRAPAPSHSETTLPMPTRPPADPP